MGADSAAVGLERLPAHAGVVDPDRRLARGHLRRAPCIRPRLAAFGVLSVACAVAPTIDVLIVARALQGAAGALVMPSSLAIIVAAFAPLERGGPSERGLPGVGSRRSPVRSPAAPSSIRRRGAGSSRSRADRRRDARVGPRRRAPDERVARRHVDFLGAGLCALGLGGVVFALIEQPHHGWTSPVILVP